MIVNDGHYTRMLEVRREITDLINQGLIDQDDVQQILRARVRHVRTVWANERYL